MDTAHPVNEAQVDMVLADIASPVTRNLVQMAVAAARMKFMRSMDQSEEDWENELPATPFDMGFFAKVVADAFKNETVVRSVVAGASIQNATGWDV